MEKNLKEKFETGVQYLPGVGPKSAQKFAKLGVETIGDLLWYFPRKYLDYTDTVSIRMINNQFSCLPAGMAISNQYSNSKNSISNEYTIKAKIESIANKKTRRRGFTITEAMVEDGTGTIKIVWFNQPYLAKMLWIGREIILHGKVNWDFFNKTYVMESPDWAENPKIVPIYKETDGVSSYYIGKIVSHVARMISEVDDFLPQQIIKENNLLTLDEAIRILHTPKDMNELDKARERMAFDELFLISLRGQVLKAEIRQDIAPVIDVEDGKIDEFISQLPYELTGDQRKAAREIINDLNKSKIKDQRPVPSRPKGSKLWNGYANIITPMNRLLNGDVGSGKTVVAAIASYATVKAGFKVLFMAPTEILAKQHYDSFSKLFEKFDINICLITSSTKNQKLKAKSQNNGMGSLLEKDALADESLPNIMIGTHALLHLKEPVENVGLVVVDEQHRFGVSQRQALRGYQRSKIKDQNDGMETSLDKNIANNSVPHFLSMTATPIPRSLQLALFGELDISTIKEKPKSRKEIKTRVVDEIHRQKAYEFIRAHVKAGRQVFVICPLIEETQKLKSKSQNEELELFELDRKTVAGEYEKLSKNVFPDLRIDMLHGKMKSKEKEAIMNLFSAQELDILVSTSVVEVGVDIPNASIMMIEDAERFGLAQLHQFCGRVGRGVHQSFCFLFSNSESQKTLARLKMMEETSDGFKLAEFDLKNRGAGDIFGLEQSGFMEIRFADLSNAIMISKAQIAAKNIILSDPKLNNHQELLDKLKRFELSKHFE